MKISRKAIAAVAGGALAVGAAIPATAEDAKPTPTSCGGLAFEDPAGDQAVVSPAVRKSPDNMDIRAGFFRYVQDASGKPVLTTNLVVAKLDKTVDTGMAGASWYFHWTNGDQGQFTRVDVIDGNVTYQYGHQATDGLTVDGTTKGRLIEGEMGVVEVVVPSGMGVAGKALTAPSGEGRIRYGASAVNNSRPVDTTADGKDFKAVVCEGPSAGASTTPPPPGPDAPPPAPGDPQAKPASVSVRAGAAKLAKRTVTVALQSSETLTNVKAKLLKAKSVVASGSLAKLPGKGTLKLKAAKKKLKKGGYTLSLTFTDASGRAGSSSSALKVR
jgi:hypothetical protein